LGRVAGFMDAGAGLLLVVPDPLEEGRERLLPFREEFLNALDLPGGRLIFDLPPGFLEL
jgi:ribosomal 30S subunit maturation factor RimM